MYYEHTGYAEDTEKDVKVHIHKSLEVKDQVNYIVKVKQVMLLGICT